jgi:Protein of unknown function (DUF1580)
MSVNETAARNEEAKEFYSSLVPLAELAKLLPCRRNGKPTHVGSLYRWSSSGSRGVILRTIQVGATRCCTHEWMNEFLEAVTAASGVRPATSQAGGVRMTKQQERREEQRRADVRAKLKALGVC